MNQSRLTRFNAVLERFMPLLTPTGVVCGFLLGSRISGFAPAVTFLFAFITFSGALSMNARDFMRVIKNPKPILVFLFSFHIVIPVAVRILAGLAFPGESSFVTGLVLLFAIPTAVSSYIWTTIHKGNGPLTLTIILIDTILAPILVPFIISTLMRTTIRIDSTGMFVSLVWMIVLPSIFGILLNQSSKGKIPSKLVPAFTPLSKLLLIAVIAINASRVTSSVTSFEPVFIPLALACFAFSFMGLFIGSLAGKAMALDRADRVSTIYAVGLRNISAALVIALEFFPARVAVPVLMGILFQQTLASVAGLIFVPNKGASL
jgi:tagaturonate reductase